MTFAPLRSDPSPSVRDYRKWTLVTPTFIDMAPSIAVSCVGPGPIARNPKNPHPGAVFRVWVNGVGKNAMLSKVSKTFPVGSIIVKEKYERPVGRERWDPYKVDPAKPPNLLTVMIKRERGFDPNNGDWQFATTTSLIDPLNYKDLGYCATCHQSQRTSDYVFREYGSYRR